MKSAKRREIKAIEYHDNKKSFGKEPIFEDKQTGNGFSDFFFGKTEERYFDSRNEILESIMLRRQFSIDAKFKMA